MNMVEGAGVGPVNMAAQASPLPPPPPCCCMWKAAAGVDGSEEDADRGGRGQGEGLDVEVPGAACCTFVRTPPAWAWASSA